VISSSWCLGALGALAGEVFMHRFLFLENWAGGWRRTARSAAVAAMALMLLGSATLLSAQKKSKNAKDAEVPEVSGISSLMPLPDGQAIELMLSQMLAAWQIGDEQLLHSFYADDVLVVSGAWEPPLQGWTNYLRAYQGQRARTQGVRLERTNTFTKVLGTSAWCTYQWEFYGQVDGVQTNAFGQTTLVLEKRGTKWLIVVNHTSVAPTPQKPVPASTAPAPESSQPLAARIPGA
jgi:ketosteroid isomerase-like protein